MKAEYTRVMLKTLTEAKIISKDGETNTVILRELDGLEETIKELEKLEEHNTSYELANAILVDKNTELIEQNAALTFNNKEQRKEIELGRQELFNANKWATHFEEQLELCKKSNITKKEFIEELKKENSKLLLKNFKIAKEQDLINEEIDELKQDDLLGKSLQLFHTIGSDSESHVLYDEKELLAWYEQHLV